jgi:hypothetical protein
MDQLRKTGTREAVALAGNEGIGRVESSGHRNMCSWMMDTFATLALLFDDDDVDGFGC